MRYAARIADCKSKNYEVFSEAAKIPNIFMNEAPAH
jgi:hypothetical protein